MFSKWDVLGVAVAVIVTLVATSTVRGQIPGGQEALLGICIAAAVATVTLFVLKRVVRALRSES